MTKKLLRAFLEQNIKISRALDSLLPERLRTDGNKYFVAHVVPTVLERGMTVYDLGGGSNPCIRPELKQRLGLRVVGLDISVEELASAPQGAYDRTIAADLCTLRGAGDADLVICQATLEHVHDTPGAIRAIAETLAVGGRACIFAPSRNAAFARLNLLLPERVKTALLFSLFPHKATGHDGFKAFYDRCTPRDIEALARDNGLSVEQCHLFWFSSYFLILTPVYAVWRVAQCFAWLVLRNDAAETFAYVLGKDAS